MRIFATKVFARFARKERLDDTRLCEANTRAERGSIDADLGGSLRTPASFCGVAGFRPSPGVVPNVDKPASLTPFSVNGPMGRTIADAHLLLRAQMGQDKRDPFSMKF